MRRLWKGAPFDWSKFSLNIADNSMALGRRAPYAEVTMAMNSKRVSNA